MKLFTQFISLINARKIEVTDPPTQKFCVIPNDSPAEAFTVSARNEADAARIILYAQRMTGEEFDCTIERDAR
jgi:hypothetical protein